MHSDNLVDAGAKGAAAEMGSMKDFVPLLDARYQ